MPDRAGYKRPRGRGFVLGSAFGILLHQRGALVLHGAAVAKDGRALAICGASGAGKSTLAAALCRRGCTLVTDDICVVGENVNQRPIVFPDGRQLKLWKESIDQLDLAELRGKAVREPFEKYYIDSPPARAQPSPLSAIYVLHDFGRRSKRESNPWRCQTPCGCLTLRPTVQRLRAKIGQKAQLLAISAATLGHAKMFLLIRRRGFEHLQETVAELRAHWGSLDK